MATNDPVKTEPVTTSPSPVPPAAPQPTPAPGAHAAAPVAAETHPPEKKKPWAWIVILVVLIGGAIASWPYVQKSLNTVSTDDAFVNGHVTFVAPRVSGQVARVLVDDNNRVRKGDLLVELDKQPYQVLVDIAQSAVGVAEANLVAVKAQVRGSLAQMRSLRFTLARSIEDVDNQIALLHSRVATLRSQKASQDKAQSDYERASGLITSGAISKEAFDLRKESLLVAQARVEEALQGVYQVRVALGLPTKPETGNDLAQVPADLNQTFSSVRQAQASLLQAAAQVGVNNSFLTTPKQMVDDFIKRDPSGDIDKIYNDISEKAPALKQAEAKLLEAQHNLEQAKLNLSYCNVVSEIDGVVTRRNVNPGNNALAGQNLMAVRSLTEVWVDANFKETQLRDLRIGQKVEMDIDMYGSKRRFEGKISGFTMGTGSTLALLPAENATGNFVKVVQRLPVRIDLIDYDPEKAPLFIGVSVEPSIHLDEQAAGANDGPMLQPYMTTPTKPVATEKTVGTEKPAALEKK